jgi:hypothetical protein
MNGHGNSLCRIRNVSLSVVSAIVIGLIACSFLSCSQPPVPPMTESKPANSASYAPVPAKASENITAAPVKFDPGGEPDRSFVKISDRIGSRDPNSANCEYHITVQNLHKTWSLKNVAVDINGTIYMIADVIGPGQTVEFYRASLPRPLTNYHVQYQWVAPQ